MVAKKYKLFSASGENAASPCAFFASEAGCRNGDSCKFLHELPPSTTTTKVEASDVSSESEGEVPAVPPPPAQDAKAANSTKKKNKKKRKKQPDPSDDIFASPKNHANNSSSSKQHPSQANVKQEKESPRKKQKKSKSQKDEPPKQADFRSLNLPVASFSAMAEQPSADAPVTTTKIKTEPTPSSSPTLPLPTHTATGQKWKDAVIETRKHARYEASFDFEKLKEEDQEAGRGSASDWITVRKYGPWCAENPQAIALDCEMCETRDPVSGAVDSKALCRISIVNADKPEEVLLDSLVKPAWPVVDYRSRINGIKEEHLANCQFTLRHAQAFLMALCSDETVIIGHALHNDLAALKMEHYCIVDSSLLFPVKDAPNATPSLKDLALTILKKEMPQTHDSVNDAGAALLCMEEYLKGKVAPIERSAVRNPIAAAQLFVHRIPKHCQATHLNTMFLSHTSVQPMEVDEVEFTGDTGRTHVTFRSSRHANLAFDTLEGKEEADKSGRMQKKVYLKNGGYVRVRMMVHSRRDSSSSGSKTPDASK